MFLCIITWISLNIRLKAWIIHNIKILDGRLHHTSFINLTLLQSLLWFTLLQDTKINGKMKYVMGNKLYNLLIYFILWVNYSNKFLCIILTMNHLWQGTLIVLTTVWVKDIISHGHGGRINVWITPPRQPHCEWDEWGDQICLFCFCAVLWFSVTHIFWECSWKCSWLQLFGWTHVYALSNGE